MKTVNLQPGVTLATAFAIRVFVPAAIVLGTTAASAFAADITGTITVKRQLTHASVTASASTYERGTAVELGRDAETDPLAAERERVVIYVEGSGRGSGVEHEAATAREEGAKAPARAAPATMQQANRRFDPEIVVIPSGSAVAFPNMDPIFHNVFSLAKVKSFDLGNFPKGETRTVTFPKPGIVYVNCRLHPNMAGVIVVTPNRWYSKAGRDGQFTLHDVPPGTYTVVAWHKTTGFIRKQVQIVEGRDSVVDYLVPIDVPAAGAGAAMPHSKMTVR
jgi:plastocyanin